MKEEVRVLVDKVDSLSEENNRLSQKLDGGEKKNADKTKELNDKKFVVNQADKDQDMIILGDFAYQFQNLLGKSLESRMKF